VKRRRRVCGRGSGRAHSEAGAPAGQGAPRARTILPEPAALAPGERSPERPGRRAADASPPAPRRRRGPHRQDGRAQARGPRRRPHRGLLRQRRPGAGRRHADDTPTTAGAARTIVQSPRAHA